MEAGTVHRRELPLRLVPRAGGFLEREGLLVGICASYVLFWSLAAPYWLQADSWLTFLGGREIVAHGLPHADTLAVVTRGHAWIDQQWLSQLLFFGLDRLGGVRLALLTTVALLIVPLTVAVAFARRRGASPTSIAPFAVLPALAFTSFLRAQLLSQVLFVVLLVLLAGESRRRTRRVLLAFPLVALWANLHGAAVVGAGLVALLGLAEVVSLARSRQRRLRPWARAVALAAGPWPCLLATPYGLSVIGYYRTTLDNPLFRQTSTEWMAPTLASVTGFSVFVLAGLAVFLAARRARDLTLYEHAVLASTLVGGFLAVRSIPWCAYACLLLLPPLLERERRGRGRSAPDPRPRLALAAVTSTAAVAALLATAASSNATLTGNWPAAATAAVARVAGAGADPHARVLASGEYGDWLLYELPELRGRVAFDGRWELLSTRQAETLLDYFWEIGNGWAASSRGYRLIVLNPRTQHRLLATLQAEAGVRVLFRDSHVAVVDRGARADAG